jgi:hypothetical protein
MTANGVSNMEIYNKQIISNRPGGPEEALELNRRFELLFLALAGAWLGAFVLSLAFKWPAWALALWNSFNLAVRPILLGFLYFGIGWCLVRVGRGRWIVCHQLAKPSAGAVPEATEFVHVCFLWINYSFLLLISQMFACDYMILWARTHDFSWSTFGREKPELEQRVQKFLSTPTEMRPKPPANAPSTSPRRFILLDQSGTLSQLPKDLQATVEDLDAGRAAIVRASARQVRVGDWYKSGRRVGPAFDNYVDIVVLDYPYSRQAAANSREYWGGEYMSNAVFMLRDMYTPGHVQRFWLGILPGIVYVASVAALNWADHEFRSRFAVEIDSSKTQMGGGIVEHP